MMIPTPTPGEPVTVVSNVPDITPDELAVMAADPLARHPGLPNGMAERMMGALHAAIPMTSEQELAVFRAILPYAIQLAKQRRGG